MSAFYRPCQDCGLSKVSAYSSSDVCEDCRNPAHNEGFCALCTGWHDAEEVAFMNRRRAARILQALSSSGGDKE